MRVGQRMQGADHAEVTSMETLLLPLESSKGSRLGEAETSLDFQEQRESKHTLESRCVDLCCPVAHRCWPGNAEVEDGGWCL